MNDKIHLVYRYLELPHVVRVEILGELGLLDAGKEDDAYYCFKKAVEINLIVKLREKVEEAHRELKR